MNDGCEGLPFLTGGFILVSDYVRMEVTLVGVSWDVVAGDQDGCGLHSYEVFCFFCSYRETSGRALRSAQVVCVRL